MAPILDGSWELPLSQPVKFVRKGEIVACADTPQDSHLDIAQRYKLGDQIDGAGRIKQLPNGDMELSGGSVTFTPKSLLESRKEDVEVVHKITGKEVLY